MFKKIRYMSIVSYVTLPFIFKKIRYMSIVSFVTLPFMFKKIRYMSVVSNEVLKRIKLPTSNIEISTNSGNSEISLTS